MNRRRRYQASRLHGKDWDTDSRRRQQAEGLVFLEPVIHTIFIWHRPESGVSSVFYETQDTGQTASRIVDVGSSNKLLL
jgi:hypothetical protein